MGCNRKVKLWDLNSVGDGMEVKNVDFFSVPAEV